MDDNRLTVGILFAEIAVPSRPMAITEEPDDDQKGK